MRVLIVEDESMTRLFLEEVLQSRGHEVVACADAESAWEQCQKSFFPLILLDWVLPGMDGLELCRRIRTLEDGFYSLVLVATTRQGAEELQAVLEAGADDYLSKPIDRRLFEVRLTIAERRVTHRLERRRGRAQLAEAFSGLEKSHDDLLAILEQTGVGTALVDGSGQITFLSEVAGRLFFGAGPPPLGKGRNWQEVLPLNQESKAQIDLVAARPVAERQPIPLALERGDGQPFWLEVEVRDDPRDAGGRIFFFHDVTEIHQLRRQLDERAEFGDLVGKSPTMQRVYQQIRELAGVDITVLVEGETGTGKELVARAIHATSQRKKGAFIAVNCAGLTESIIGSQLFGHRRGAFTGALEDREGFLEAADGGTLFLDEIGDVPLSIQANLLRVLQEREVVRLGETRPRKIDVRVLAATNRDLGEEVARGNFRQDLLYRIRIAAIQLPPLRQRREDIPLLVGHFLRSASAAQGKRVNELSPEALRLLMVYSWPGNVRELQNAVEVAVVRAASPQILPADLPAEVHTSPSPPPAGRDGRALPPALEVPATEEPAWPEDERERLLAALERAGGNRSRAAQLLGVSRATFYRHMARLGID